MAQNDSLRTLVLSKWIGPKQIIRSLKDDTQEKGPFVECGPFFPLFYSQEWPIVELL